MEIYSIIVLTVCVSLLFNIVASFVKGSKSEPIMFVGNDFKEVKQEAHDAMRSVNVIVKKLGYKINQYRYLDETGIYIEEEGDLIDLADEIKELQNNFNKLLKYLNLEITDGSTEIRSKASNGVKLKVKSSKK